MYEEYFGFRQPPFAATPHAHCFFAPPRLGEIRDELALRLEAGQGICLLTAAAGLGKTLFTRIVADEISARFHVVRLAAPGSLNRRAFLQTLLADLRPTPGLIDEHRLRLEVIAALRDSVRNERPCVVVVDEAHLLSGRVLEELRGLTIQDELGQPLLRVMLAGQLKLEETLTAPEFDALNQQIVSHRLLEPFSLTESVEYVLYRIATAGGDPERQFTIPALDLIVHAAGGNPRLMNRLCDLGLILTCAQGRTQVDLPQVEQALSDLKQLPLHWNEVDPRSFDGTSETSRSDESSIGTESRQEDDLAPESASELFTLDEEALIEQPRLDASGPLEREPHSRFLDELNKTATKLQIESPSATFDDSAPPPAASLPAFEAVPDRYASLDPQRPRLLRTYDDQSLAADWYSRGRGVNPLPQSPPEPPADLTFDALPVRAQTAATPGSVAESPAEARPLRRDEDRAPWLTRRSASGGLRPVDSGLTGEEFDVVEPESKAPPTVSHPSPVAPRPGSAPHDHSPPGNHLQATAERASTRIAAVHQEHVSPPPGSTGMGTLFSTLRRKLGRSPGR